MCVEGWKRKRWNPAGIKVVTYEARVYIVRVKLTLDFEFPQMAHKPEEFDLRGGATTADHIDILGSSALNGILLRVAAGDSDGIEDHFVSVGPKRHAYVPKLRMITHRTYRNTRRGLLGISDRYFVFVLNLFTFSTITTVPPSPG